MPSFVPKRICQFVATASEASYYTTPASTATILKQCIVANTTAVTQSLGLSVVPFGNAAGNANRIIPNTAIPGNSSVVLDITTVLATGDFISAIASLANSLTVTISGMESPGSNGASTGSTVSTPISWGSPVAVATANADGVSTLLSRADHVHRGIGVVVPVVRVRQTVAQAMSGNWLAITFGVVEEDTLSGTTPQWASGASSRLVCQLAGVYNIEGTIGWTAAAGGSRGAGLRKNGTGATGPALGTNLTMPNISWSHKTPVAANGVRLAVNDYVELVGVTTVNTNTVLEDGDSHFSWTYMGA